MKKLAIIIIIILLVLSIFAFIGLMKAAYASDQDYEICLNRCYLDLPDLKECISDEKENWEVNNISDSVVKRTCKDMIRNEKIDCQVKCIAAGIRFVDEAIVYYDTDVKNFPLINE
jgi:hypothetical protein